MIPDEQRIAIAGACGWKDIIPRRWGGYTDVYGPLCTPADSVGAPAKYWGYVPDYLNDLNAMAEAERGLGDDQQRIFIRYLICADQAFDRLADFDPVLFTDRESQVADHLCGIGWDEVWCFVLRATAAQRAEAFLRTVGKWDDAQ